MGNILYSSETLNILSTLSCIWNSTAKGAFEKCKYLVELLNSAKKNQYKIISIKKKTKILKMELTSTKIETTDNCQKIAEIAKTIYLDNLVKGKRILLVGPKGTKQEILLLVSEPFCHN